MQIPQIRMQSTQGMIGLETSLAELEPAQSHAQMEIQQPKAKVEMSQAPAQLTIDQTEAWADMNLINILRRVEQAAQQGKRDVLEGIARRAQQGNELMKIENGGNAIASQAKVNGYKPMYNMNIAYIPKPGSVKINIEPSRVNIDVKPSKPIIDVQINKTTGHYTPGQVHAYVQQKNNLEITFE
ncbi:MAG TPA: DUF6470 family protein [Metabacillus sp.]|nr:DUF6470 family protein [Metabacillus sp.]